MAYFDLATPTVATPESDEENRRKVLAAIAAGRNNAPLGRTQPDQPPPALTTNAPGSRNYDLNVSATNQPSVPAPRLTPTEAPSISPPLGKTPSILGAQPARPNVVPRRTDFPSKPVPTWEKVLGVAAAPFLPNLTQNILGGPERRANQQYQAATKEWERGQEAETRQANIRNIDSEIAARANPKDKPENLQQNYADAVSDAIRRNVDPATDPTVQRWADAITSLQKQPPVKPDTATQEDQRYENIQAAQSQRKPVSKDDAAWAKAYEKRKTLGPALTAGAAATRQDKSFDQQEKMFKMREQALTAATKTMVEAAPTVEGLASRVEPLIDKLDSELGPGSGRWSEFWAGKVGSKNPEYTKLRTDVGLLQTALMRMHVGARGGQEMMTHFKDIIDQGKQDPDNMRAALSEIRQYVSDLKAKGTAGGMSSAVLNSESGGKTKPAAGGFTPF